jgi:ring-1,2-phenylacetyl-CoA epoxidase subunit PaaD
MPPGEELARRLAAEVPDPELPFLTLEDLGILRRVEVSPEGTVRP